MNDQPKDDVTALIEDHASDMQRLFALMLQVYSGGSGIDQISTALLDAAESYTSAATAIEALRGDGSDRWWSAHRKFVAVMKEAISPPEADESDGIHYDSFYANKWQITQLAAKMTAHVMLEHPGRGSNQKRALMNLVERVGAHQARLRR